MAIDPTKLETLRDALIRARAAATRVVMMDGRRVEYGTDAEMADAIADLESRVRRASTPRRGSIAFATMKGACRVRTDKRPSRASLRLRLTTQDGRAYALSFWEFSHLLVTVFKQRCEQFQKGESGEPHGRNHRRALSSSPKIGQ